MAAAAVGRFRALASLGGGAACFALYRTSHEIRAAGTSYSPVHPQNPDNSVCELDFTVNGQPAGAVEVELFDDTVPKTAKNFRVLCAGNYAEWAKTVRAPQENTTTFSTLTNFFNRISPPEGMVFAGSLVHRIIPGFMMQAGDFTAGNGTGGRAIYMTGKFPDESFAGKAGTHYRGSLSMANSGPDTNGSQFFICYERLRWLDGRHVVFGQVLNGYDVAQRIEAHGTRSGATSAQIRITATRVKKYPTGDLEQLAALEPRPAEA